MSTLDRAYHIIQKPVVSEKASDDSLKRNAYHLRVPVDANKIEIRQAVEKIFDVKVVSVNTLKVRSKPRRRGWASCSAARIPAPPPPTITPSKESVRGLLIY